MQNRKSVVVVTRSSKGVPAWKKGPTMPKKPSQNLNPTPSKDNGESDSLLGDEDLFMAEPVRFMMILVLSLNIT